MFRNIIWDVDGTIFNTYPPIARAFKDAVKGLGKDAPLNWIEGLAKKSFSYCTTTLATEYSLEKYDIEREFKTHYSKISAGESPPFPGVEEICDYICSINGKNVIVTHRGRKGTLELLSAHDLIDYFAGYIVRDDGYPRKPSPAAFIAVIEGNNLDKIETINIGDREIDIVAGQSMGIFSCLYGSESINVKPDLVVNDYGDLYQFILDSNK